MPFEITDSWIIQQRGDKNPVDPWLPYAFLTEKEHNRHGKVEDVATIFLTNKECPFHCLMCDLWKNTLSGKTPTGAIPSQIAYALEKLPKSRNLKLYNSGNFFDSGAIPPSDYSEIARLVARFETLVVECHPKLINKKCLDFQQLIEPELQVAIGLETVHPKILPLLNKQMTLGDFKNSVHFLNDHGIASRAFILLGLPHLSEQENIRWTQESMEWAFDACVECCVVIPTRMGIGAMEQFHKAGNFREPRIQSLEEVLEFGLRLNAGRVFADLWDLGHFSNCGACFGARKDRLQQMNLTQTILPQVDCSCNMLGARP